MFTLLTYLISFVENCDPAIDSTRIRMKGRWHNTPTRYNDQLRSAVQFMKKSAACTPSVLLPASQLRWKQSHEILKKKRKEKNTHTHTHARTHARTHTHTHTHTHTNKQNKQTKAKTEKPPIIQVSETERRDREG